MFRDCLFKSMPAHWVPFVIGKKERESLFFVKETIKKRLDGGFIAAANKMNRISWIRCYHSGVIYQLMKLNVFQTSIFSVYLRKITGK